jgi:twinkle protein
MRKGNSEAAPGGKFDVKGAGELTDLADNVFLVWRNKGKEDALQKDPHDIEAREEPDAMLTVAKQRHGDYEGRIMLDFNLPSKQYISRGMPPWKMP